LGPVSSPVLTFTAGTGTTRTFSVSVVNDATAEGREDYSVTIGNVSTGQIGFSHADTEIQVDGADGQPAPIWSIAGSSAVGEGGTAIYTVAYTGAPIQEGQTATIVVNSTGGGFTPVLPNATAGVDYTNLATTLTFTRGTGTAQTVAVSTIADAVV